MHLVHLRVCSRSCPGIHKVIQDKSKHDGVPASCRDSRQHVDLLAPCELYHLSRVAINRATGKEGKGAVVAPLVLERALSRHVFFSGLGGAANAEEARTTSLVLVSERRRPTSENQRIPRPGDISGAAPAIARQM